MIKKFIMILLVIISYATLTLMASEYKSEREFFDDVLLYEENVKKIKSCFDHISSNLSVQLKTILLFKEIDKRTAHNSDFKFFMDNLVEVTIQQENIVDKLYNDMIHGNVLKPLFLNLINKPTTQTWGDCFKDLFPKEKQSYFGLSVWENIASSPHRVLLFKFFFDRGVYQK